MSQRPMSQDDVCKETSPCDCDRCLLAELGAAALEGQRRGWEGWYRRDGAAVLRYIERRCRRFGCVEQSEDILHDCFLIAVRHVAHGRYRNQERGLTAYLVGIAKNLIRDAVRRQQRAPLGLDGCEAAGEDDAGMEEDRVYVEQVVMVVARAWLKQPQLSRRVLAGIYAEGRSADELGSEIGKNAGNVRTIAHRAVHSIATQVEGEHRLGLSADAVRACLAAGAGQAGAAI